MPIKIIMGLIKKPAAGILVIALFFAGETLHAQNIPAQLGAEIQTIEQQLSAAGISSSERYSALARLARLRQLSGNIAGAAGNWLEAAAANPQDITAPMSGAYCLAAIGEWEKAAAALRPLLTSNRGGPVILQAWFLDACLRTWSTGDASALATLAVNSEFTALRPAIYYTLWQAFARNPGLTGAGNAEQWKSRLLAEFPKSPEARAINPQNQQNAPVISTVHSPLWLLLPGGAGSAHNAPVKPAGAAASAPVAPVASAPVAPAAAAPAASAPAASAPAAPAPALPAPAASIHSGVVLQTGLFSRETNAHVQLEALRKAGFTASISRKVVNGVEYWTVLVPAGQDSRSTISELKKAGFDSFPVN